MPSIRVALAQLNLRVGAIDANAQRIVEVARIADTAKADVVLFPELSITGYPPEDLLLRPSFVEAADIALADIAREIGDTAAVVGVPITGRDLGNGAVVLHRGRAVGWNQTHLLPNYGVFDEHRYFVVGEDAGPLFEIAGVRCGVSICEDSWSPTGPLLAIKRSATSPMMHQIVLQ